MDITARTSDDNTRRLVRACELARLQRIEANTADRFQIASRLPGYVDNERRPESMASALRGRRPERLGELATLYNQHQPTV